MQCAGGKRIDRGSLIPLSGIGAVMLFLVFIVDSSAATTLFWEQVGPEGGNIWFLVPDPLQRNRFYVGTEGGSLYATNNGGESHSLLFARGVDALLVHPQAKGVLYVVKDHQLLISRNDGRDWSPVTSRASAGTRDPLDYVKVVTLAIDPNRPGGLFAGTERHGLLWSPDEGSTWVFRNKGLPISPQFLTEQRIRVGTMLFHPQKPSRIYLGTDSGVFVSQDTGKNWHLAGPELSKTPIFALALDPRHPQILYAGTFLGVHLSGDGGASWAESNEGLPRGKGAWGKVYGSGVTAIAVDPHHADWVYAGTKEHGLFRSRNGGRAWEPIKQGLPMRWITTLLIDPLRPRTLYAGGLGEQGGVWVSHDGAAHWDPRNKGMKNFFTSALAFAPADPKVLYLANHRAVPVPVFGQGIFLSRDGGRTWRFQSHGPSEIARVTCLTAHPHQAETLYAGTWEQGIYLSRDGGRTWLARGFQQGESSSLDPMKRGAIIHVIVIDPVHPYRVFAATDRGLFFSKDKGNTWQTAQDVSGLPIRDFLAYPSMPMQFYAISRDRMFISRDGGARWTTHLANPPRGSSIVAAVALPRKEHPLLFSVGEKTTYRSEDGGVRWEPVRGISGLFIRAIRSHPRNPHVLYAGTPKGLYESADGGKNWSLMEGLPADLSIETLAVSLQAPHVLLAGTFGQGVLKIRLEDVDVQSSRLPNVPCWSDFKRIAGLTPTRVLSRGRGARQSGSPVGIAP